MTQKFSSSFSHVGWLMFSQSLPSDRQPCPLMEGNLLVDYELFNSYLPISPWFHRFSIILCCCEDGTIWRWDALETTQAI